MAENPKILIFGDSLSAVYGVAQSQGWPALLQNKLKEKNQHYDVINASISGETTSGGLSRLASVLAEFKPNIIILELGANDGLRGLPVQEMEKNLNEMIVISKKTKAKIVLIGMKIPPNYGPKYSTEFRQTYTNLSQQHNITLVPFMLENVATNPKLTQDDGLHPNSFAQPLILENIWPKLHGLLNPT
jgi:acyl-CoA thioesterase-1